MGIEGARRAGPGLDVWLATVGLPHGEAKWQRFPVKNFYSWDGTAERRIVRLT